MKMGAVEKLVIVWMIFYILGHEGFRALLSYLPLQDSIGLQLTDKLPVFSTTKYSVRIYQVTDKSTFITAYIRPSETGGLAQLIGCDLYKGRSREMMVTELTDDGRKDPNTVMNVISEPDDLWRYSYLLDSCFWHRRGKHFDLLVETEEGIRFIPEKHSVA